MKNKNPEHRIAISRTGIAYFLILGLVFLFSNSRAFGSSEDSISGQKNNEEQVFAEDNESEESDEYSRFRFLGLSREAANVYMTQHGFAYSGYGEMLYEDFASKTNIGTPSGEGQQLGVIRGALFLGYRFSERLLFNSEVRLDRDLTDSRTGQVSVDSAYLDYLLNNSFNLRAGVILVPMGLTNEFHQPDELLGTHPPLPDTFTIPSIWHALGVGIVGHKWIGDYRVYVMNGLNAGGFTVMGLRNGREISGSTLKNPSFVVRLDGHFFPHFILGISYYLGNSGVFDTQLPVDLKVHTTNKEAHAEFRNRKVLVRAQYAKALLKSTPKLNAILGTTGLNGIGDRIVGGYIEGGYDLFGGRKNGTRLMPYMRVEVSNPQDGLPPGSLALGLLKNLEVDHTVYTYGVEYRPKENLVIKTDYQFVHTEHHDIGVNQFNIVISYLFSGRSVHF
jgi:hypothetical protein